MWSSPLQEPTYNQVIIYASWGFLFFFHSKHYFASSPLCMSLILPLLSCREISTLGYGMASPKFINQLKSVFPSFPSITNVTISRHLHSRLFSNLLNTNVEMTKAPLRSHMLVFVLVFRLWGSSCPWVCPTQGKLLTEATKNLPLKQNIYPKNDN